ncbi:protein Mo25-like [Anopheles bellator]|uniref:protein Mo25-like n=1 Tax=Anopheles bellator TaxID=139047 RepID=UPI0026490595|nr:protein Mo25-like [Anopheles bellator]
MIGSSLHANGKHKKSVVQIFNNMLRRSIGVPSITVKYICKKPKILLSLMAGYENEENAHDCHSMLSECTRYQELAKLILHSEAFFNLFCYVEVLKCDVSFAAFSMLKQLLTGHKRLCAEFLEQKYDNMFTHYKQLLSSENYMIRRESVALLSTLLGDWYNVTIKRKYISDPDNLQLIVNMLSEKHRCVPHNAYDVLKLFVANPDKPRPIIDILVHNREKLNHYIFQVTTDRPEDAQPVAEKIGLIITITYLTSH